ncbi:MAG: hypothetical protein J6S45_06820, partial [Firmicutes bacterium]|nr:hypothetical protein [Bacillota bacterium]
MLLLKKKALALSMAAILLFPAAAYGQSSEVSTADTRDCVTQFIQFLEYFGIRWEDGKLPEIELPEIEIPETEVPDMDEAIPQ